MVRDGLHAKLVLLRAKRRAPSNMEIRCANTACDFTRDRPLPVLTVDEPIYRRLPAFLIATVDKFASLPWVGELAHSSAMSTASRRTSVSTAPPNPGSGRPLDNGWTLDPPDLIIQDELHSDLRAARDVAGLYEAAIDQLASRGMRRSSRAPEDRGFDRHGPAGEAQIAALVRSPTTCMFPPPGIDRTDSFFARTVPSSRGSSAALLGIAAQGRDPSSSFCVRLRPCVRPPRPSTTRRRRRRDEQSR